jgi:hypothetical protein
VGGKTVSFSIFLSFGVWKLVATVGKFHPTSELFVFEGPQGSGRFKKWNVSDFLNRGPDFGAKTKSEEGGGTTEGCDKLPDSKTQKD